MSIPTSIKEQISKKDPAFTHLDLNDRGLNDNDMAELQELLQDNPYITSLNLSGNFITAEGCQQLCSIPRLKKVDLSHCHVGDKGVSYLLKTNIEILNLSACGLTEEGAGLLLRSITRFKSLSIGRNPGISELLVYKIHKNFIPGLQEPRTNSLPAGVGLDLGLNIGDSSWMEDNRPVEIISTAETPFEKKQSTVEAMSRFGLRRSSEGAEETKDPGSPPDLAFEEKIRQEIKAYAVSHPDRGDLLLEQIKNDLSFVKGLVK